MRRTRIVGTIGPASDDEASIRALLRAGLNVARLNYSHGSLEDKSSLIRRLRKISDEEGIPLGLLADLPGPKLRLGRFEETLDLRSGDRLIFHCGRENGRDVTPDMRSSAELLGDSSPVEREFTTHHTPVPYAGLSSDLQTDDPVLLADGIVRLIVEVPANGPGKTVVLRVVDGGKITERKGINVPGTVVRLPSIGEKDKLALEHALSHEIDFIAVSYVRTPEDLYPAKDAVKAAGRHTPVIAKIEHPSALKQLDEILDQIDGVMVARGDLGVEVPLEELPFAQERILNGAMARGIPAIVATQVLESMIENPVPTRAEVMDIANGIRQGASALMLSGETAVGAHPITTVETMSRIASKVDLQIAGVKTPISSTKYLSTRALAHAAVVLADEVEADHLLVCTEHCTAARLASGYRPPFTVIAITDRERAVRRSTLLRGVDSVLVEEAPRSRDTIQNALSLLFTSGRIKSGDLVVTTSGSPLAISGSTSTIRLLRIGDEGKISNSY